MGTLSGQPRVIKFGVFEVDLQSGEVRKAGMRQKLAGQPFQVLQALLEHPQEIVTREQFRQRLWPDNTFVDYELALKKAVNRLREVLGDSPDNPRFIETIPRHGYRFIGSVEAPTRPEPVSTTTIPASRRKAWTLAVGLGLTVVAALTIGLNAGKLRTRIFAKSRSLEIHSIAVLPLENMSKDPSQDYFSDGMTDALTTELAQIGSLRVISRTSATHFKNSKETLTEIGHQLNVDAIVEGSVTRSENRVRITAQLIDAQTDLHLWAKTYERDLKDVLALQDNVARDIAEEIRVKLKPEELARLTATRTVDPAAHESYSKGRYHWNQRTESGLRAGVQDFQKAIELQPDYPEAYAGLADSYITLANWRFIAGKEAYPRAEAAARKALELDDHLAEAQTSLAYASFLYDWDWSGAEQRFRRAIELSPNYATAHHFYSIYLMAAGRHAEAQAEIRRAQELDPLSLIINSVVGWIYYHGRQYDLDIQQCERTVEMDPNYAPALLDLGMIYMRTGDYPRALAQFERAQAIAGDTSVVLSYLAQVRALSGNQSEARKILRRLEKPSTPMFVSAWDLALIYAALGEKEKALTQLEKAADQHVGWIVLLGVDPALDSLRAEPRFRALQQRVHIPRPT